MVRRRLDCIGFIMVVLACLLGFPSPADAILTVVTNGTVLTRFESSLPGNVTTVTITGMQTGEKLIGIDFRPSNGLLYGVGTTNRLYILNYLTGATRQVGPAGGFTLPVTSTAFGLDIDPTADVLRFVTNDDGNGRIDLDTGMKVGDGLDGGISEGSAVSIPAIGYKNNFQDASTTTLFGINTVEGTLVTIGRRNSAAPDFNTGFVQDVGSLGLGANLSPLIGFDIAPLNNGTLASITVSGESRLYIINLANGVASLVGKIGNGATPYSGLAILSGPQTFSNTDAIFLPAAGSTGGAGNDRADPFPAILQVSEVTLPVSRLRLTLHDFRHHYPDDVDIALVSPDFKSLVVMSDAGGDGSTCGTLCNNTTQPGSVGVTITFDDNAAAFLPNGPGLVSGTFKPTDYADAAADPFPPPAPGNPTSAAPTGTGTLRSTFIGEDANGPWGLYIKDDAQQDSGRIAGGWTLEVTSAPPCLLSCPGNVQANSSGGQCGAMVDVPRPSLTGACGTFTPAYVNAVFFPVGTTAVTTTTEAGPSCGFSVTINDTQAPAISCHANITAQADPGQNATVVNFEPAGVVDNCSATPTYKPASGSFFAVGETIVIGTAIDAAGNTSTCSFTVTVMPNSASAPARFANISTRLRVETGDNALIGGFIITGTQPKKVLLRAIGPSLPLAGALANPILELYSGSQVLEVNDNWIDSSNKQAIIDSTIPPANDLESAIVATLPANNSAYTAIVRGANNGTGIGLVEAYDLDSSANSRLANISTRGLVQTGDNVLIAGTIVLGSSSQKVIIRAIGPSLPVAGKLENPTLELRDGNGALLEGNDDWINSANKQAIIDSTIPPTNNLESAIVRTLTPASYTAIVRGVNDTTGIAVVEVYALP
jgi:hypothetical protein